MRVDCGHRKYFTTLAAHILRKRSVRENIDGQRATLPEVKTLGYILKTRVCI